MAKGRKLCLTVTLAAALATTAALADDALRPTAPEQPARAGGLFGSSAPAPAKEAGEPLDIRPVILAMPVAAKEEPQPRRVDVPLPPAPQRPKEQTAATVVATSAPTAAPAARAGAAQAPVASFAGDPGAASPLKAAAAPGFFSWLASLNAEPVVTETTQVASLTSPRGGRLDLSDPYRPKRMPGTDERDDDLEDEESRKLVEKQADHVQIACLKPRLMRMINAAGAHFKGTPIITSGYRGYGRRGSYHRRCEAADFFITGVSSRELTAYLRRLPGAGGVGTYCHTKSVHLDTGEPRNWHQCGFRRSFALRDPVPQIGSR